jgi:hypothetical protein
MLKNYWFKVESANNVVAYAQKRHQAGASDGYPNATGYTAAIDLATGKYFEYTHSDPEGCLLSKDVYAQHGFVYVGNFDGDCVVDVKCILGTPIEYEIKGIPELLSINRALTIEQAIKVCEICDCLGILRPDIRGMPKQDEHKPVFPEFLLKRISFSPTGYSAAL